MTETSTPSSDAPISEKMEHVRRIVERLDAGDVSLERAKELRDEGRELLGDIEDDLELGDGTVIENRS